MNIQRLNKRIGATLIELVALITIITGSTGTVVVGSKYYIEHNDRSQCLTNLADVQKAVRHHQNVNLLKVGAPLVRQHIIGQGRPLSASQMECPTNGSEYKLVTHYPPSGIAAAKCGDFDGSSGKLDSSKNHTHTHNYNW